MVKKKDKKKLVPLIDCCGKQFKFYEICFHKIQLRKLTLSTISFDGQCSAYGLRDKRTNSMYAWIIIHCWTAAEWSLTNNDFFRKNPTNSNVGKFIVAPWNFSFSKSLLFFSFSYGLFENVFKLSKLSFLLFFFSSSRHPIYSDRMTNGFHSNRKLYMESAGRRVGWSALSALSSSPHICVSVQQQNWLI